MIKSTTWAWSCKRWMQLDESNKMDHVCDDWVKTRNKFKATKRRCEWATLIDFDCEITVPIMIQLQQSMGNKSINAPSLMPQHWMKRIQKENMRKSYLAPQRRDLLKMKMLGIANQWQYDIPFESILKENAMASWLSRWVTIWRRDKFNWPRIIDGKV